MFSRRPNSNQASICILGYTANRVWLISHFIYISLINGILFFGHTPNSYQARICVLGFSVNSVWLVVSFIFLQKLALRLQHTHFCSIFIFRVFSNNSLEPRNFSGFSTMHLEPWNIWVCLFHGIPRSTDNGVHGCVCYSPVLPS